MKDSERKRKAKSAARREAIDSMSRKKGNSESVLIDELMRLSDAEIEARYQAARARNRA